MVNEECFIFFVLLKKTIAQAVCLCHHWYDNEFEFEKDFEFEFFTCRMELDEQEESIQALRNLVLLVGSLTTCGFIELKPTSNVSSGSLFQMPGFTVPVPAGKGKSLTDFCLI